MAGQLTISTLNDSSGVLATQNGMSGIAKAWVNFNGTGTVAIRGSFNVSSITDNGTGNYTVNYTTAMPDTNYAPQVSVGSRGVAVNTLIQASSLASNSMQITNYESAVLTDGAFIYAAVFR